MLATYRNGYEWLVRFENGLRFRRPSAEFSAELLPTIPQPHHTPFIPPSPMPRDQLAARQLIEALRVGIAPAQHVNELTIGLASEQSQSAAGAGTDPAGRWGSAGGCGEYGFGKSHLVELASMRRCNATFS